MSETQTPKPQRGPAGQRGGPGGQRGGPRGGRGGPRSGSRGRGRDNQQEEGDDLLDRLVHINRVAKVVKGGRRFSFGALVVIGDGRGRVGFGTGKAREVPEAIRKATDQAKRNMVQIPLREGRTLHHDVNGRYGAGRVVLRAAPPGTGIIAGGPTFRTSLPNPSARLTRIIWSRPLSRRCKAAPRRAASPPGAAKRSPRSFPGEEPLLKPRQRNNPMADSKKYGTVKITQIRSPIGRPKDQRATLVGLGLNKMHKSSELEDTPAVQGMIEKVRHLIRVEEG